MVAREAMAHGRPVVATAVGGLLDAVEDGVTGILVPPGDVARLRVAVAALLEDGARRLALGRAARARIGTALDPAAIARTWAMLYDEAADA